MNPQSAPSTELHGVAQVLRALRNRNYRLFFSAQAISLVGNFMSMTAIMWLVFRLSGESALMLGFIGFAAQIPTFLLGPFGGVWVDRLDRRKVLILTQTLGGLESFALAVLTLTHLINIPLLILLAVIQGVINALDMPARQAIVVDMVEHRDDLPNAIALNSTLVQLARLIGPSLGGLLIWKVGEGLCFLLDGVTYIGVVYAFCIMKTLPVEQRKRTTTVFSEMKAGLIYAYNSIPIRSILIVLAIFGLTGFPALTQLLPIFGEALAGGREGALTYGLLYASLGMGALIGSLWLASRQSVRGLVRVSVLMLAAFVLAVVGFAFSRTLWLSMPLIAVCGAGMMVSAAALNTVLQTLAEDDKRGRVMSLYVMALQGMIPWGSLLAGTLASSLTNTISGWQSLNGATATLIIMGALVFAETLWFALKLPLLRKIIRPIYIQKGIMPEVAVGLRGAVTLTGDGRAAS